MYIYKRLHWCWWTWKWCKTRGGGGGGGWERGGFVWVGGRWGTAWEGIGVVWFCLVTGWGEWRPGQARKIPRGHLKAKQTILFCQHNALAKLLNVVGPFITPFCCNSFVWMRVWWSLFYWLAHLLPVKKCTMFHEVCEKQAETRGEFITYR